MAIKVLPAYASISLVADLCEVWIELWGGDEWGYSMSSLHGACHTSYGFSDEDCALFASKLFENLEVMKDWVLDEGWSYGDFWEPEILDEVEARCREIRDYWLKGGNLTGSEHAIDAAKQTLDTIPGWVFGEPRPEARNA